jgi:hypothetical protein
MKSSQLESCVLSTAAIFLLASSAAFAQQQSPPPPPPAHDMHHMHHGGFMQDMHHAVAKGVKLDQQVDDASHTITLRVGPISLPANTDHMKMPQPADLIWTVPVDGWLLAYTPRLVDASGAEVPGHVLHHVAFWNTSRSDFLCPNKEEHIFGAGSELTNWTEIPGYGYHVQKGDQIRVETMVHNPWDTPYDKVYLEVKIPFAGAGADPKADLTASAKSNSKANANPGTAPVEGSGYGGSALRASVKSVYPAWMDVESCRDSGYDLKAGKSQTVGNVTVKYDGVLLGVGGHLHDYGRQLVLEDTTRKETVVTLDAKVNDKGELLSIPVVTFYDKGGYKFAAGDQLKITATYDNPTGKLLRDGAMGIVVGYFVPSQGDAAMASLRRKPKAAGARQVAASANPEGHDH